MSGAQKVLDAAPLVPISAKVERASGSTVSTRWRAAAIVPGDQSRWYCVETERLRETEVRDRLEDQGFAHFLPLIIAMRPIKPGIMQAKAVPAFPGYLFARFDVGRDRWRSIVYTRGVRGLFSSSPDRPMAVPQRQMDVLIALGYDRPIAEDPRPKLIEAGTRVRVTEGAFANFEGVCLWDDRKRVELLIDIFGRSSKLTVAKGDVAVVAV